MAEDGEEFADDGCLGPLVKLVAHFVQQFGMLVNDLNDIVKVIT